MLATGYNVIDVAAAKEKGIVVCNLPGYSTASVAQHVFALLLELTNAVGLHSLSVKEGGWQRSADWAYTLQPTIELSGKTIGIVGFGNIGQQVARIAAAFNMKVIYFNPREKVSAVGTQTSLDTLFREGDVITLHCPLTEENRGMVNRELLQCMKSSAFLINTARGPLIDEEALAMALNDGLLAGAALDVLSTEPPTEKQLSLVRAKNCLITPHQAWMTKEARLRVINMSKQNIEAFLSGAPINRVV
jgi:glycerate dehydrogenase